MTKQNIQQTFSKIEEHARECLRLFKTIKTEESLIHSIPCDLLQLNTHLTKSLETLRDIKYFLSKHP